MDTKGLQHCKHPKKMKSSNDTGKHEVFVLPPDILKKLGISIGNINETQGIPTNANVAPSPEIINHEQITNIPISDCSKNSSDTSILETASLMKKSVFLSPTFIPTIANVIPGEVEISSKNNTDSPIAVTDLVGAQSSVYIPVDSLENTNIYPETYETRKACHNIDQLKLSCDHTVNGVFTSVTNNIQDYPHVPLDGNEMQVADVNSITQKNLTKVERVNDILYDSHSSKTANILESTIKPTDSSCVSDVNVDAVKPEQKLTSKINIISEETIPLPKLKQLKSFQTSHINTLTPITVNTIISNKLKNKNSSSEATGSSEQIPTETLNNAELTVVNSEVNTNESNLKPKDNIQNSGAPRVISSQEDENASGRNSDIARNIIENIKLLENEKKTKRICKFNLLDHTTTVGEETVENGVSSDKEAIVIGQFNERLGTIGDTISGNITTVNGIEKHGIDADSVDKEKCVKSTHVYYNGQLDKSTKPVVSYIHDHHSTENEHDPKEDNAGKPGTIGKDSFIDKYDIPGNSSSPDFNFESDSKQVTDSKTIVANDFSMRTIDSKQTSNNITSLKNINEKPLCNDELVNILNATKELSSSNSNIKVDKVKEIAAYLKKFSHIYTDKKKIKKDLRNDKIKKDKLNSNTNMIKSKLSIQGVEKPGGKEVDRENPDECKVLKTYTRRNHLKKSNLPANILHKSEPCATVDKTTNHEINTVNSSTLCKMQEFCLCHDFGRLAYYDNDSVYEHIHYWQHNGTNCELNVIFSMYSDEAIVNKDESGLYQEQKTEEKVETYNVCWNAFQSEFSENLDIFDTEQIQDDYSIDELNDACFGETPTVLELNNLRQEEYNTVEENSSKIVHQGHIMVNNNQNPDIILETVDHEMDGTADSKNTDGIKILPNIEKSLNTNKHNDNSSSSVVTSIEIAYSKIKDTDFSTTEPNIPCTTPSKSVSSQSGMKSDIIEKVSMEARGPKEENAFDTKEKTYTNDQHTDSESNTMKPPRKEGKLDLPKPNENTALKRTLSVKTVSESSQNSNDEPSLKKNIKCGLCNNLFSEVDWDDHVTNQHHLIAWREGHSINLDSPDLLHKLKQRLESLGVLNCSICNTKWKKVKKFKKHVKDCIKQKDSNLDKSKEKPTRKSRAPVNEVVTCGVCQQTVQSASWLEHIGRNHNYLAWVHGQESLNVADEAMVWEHLQNIIRLDGTLTCYKCGLNRRRVKLYLAHIKTCDGSGTCLDDSSMNVDFNSTSNLEDVEKPAETNIVKCGVCKHDVTDSKWIEHIAKEHNYLAWQDGSTPLDLEEEEDVWNHLQQFIRQNGGLTCYKCGLTRRRVKLYLSHVETCDGTGVSMDSSTSLDLNSSSLAECVKRSRSSVADEKIVECGVCKQKVSNSNWIEHIGKEHNYLAWQDGTTPLDSDNKEAVWQHLQQIVKCSDGLTCYKCGLHRKRVKLYLSHVENCDGSESRSDSATNNISLDSTLKTDQWFEVPILSEEKKIVKCGVCSQEVPILEWIQHIGKEHNYLAWQDGSPPLNLEDELAVRGHLLNTSKQNGGLICSMCDKNIKYPKTYLQHVKECTGITVSLDDSQLNDSDNKSNVSLSSKVKTEAVTCGVCGNKIESGEWIEHIQQVHQYMAWIEGQPPVDVNDAAMVHKHLTDISKMAGGLICLKCGVRRKYVKSYLQHVETCEGNMFGGELSLEMMNKDFLECGICAEKVTPKDWRDHAMKTHYNIAWVVGETPIDLNSPYAVESFLKEYMHRYNKLICKVCGISRASYVGFYAHIITCGKTEQETEMYKNVCDICHNKYLIIYRSQHMTMHREQEYALERKALAAKEKELKREEPVDVIQTGRRKAAEKAKTVIEKYKDSINEGAHHCSKCGFGTDIEKELSDHVCLETKWGDATDSDESVNLEHCSDDDSDESDIDSNISEEEQEAREQDSHKKKRYSDNTSSSTPASKISRLPYQIKSINTYMKRSTEEFTEAYLTDEDLFTQWHSCEFEAVPDDEVLKYMPPIEESCKVKFDDNLDWQSFNRFESRREKDTIIMFVGARIQCLSWAPAQAEAGAARAAPQYVAALGQLRDVPRLAWHRARAGPGLIQIWDCGDLISTTPQFALGIAHDYGTIWAIDWCPSGARDIFDDLPGPNKIHRLGLLAAACSNGSAYIFLVPYPSAITEKDKLFYKVKPVVELRLTMNIDREGYENRKCYQATAIKWSVLKGHSHIVVGYADGTTAYYDLNGDSPLLRTTENSVTIFYPYHDDRVQNSCIEDVDMYPSSSARAGGLVAVGSVGGAGVGGAGGAGAGALQSHVAAARVVFPPHWPAALLAGDDCLVNQSINELEWWGGGRRLGGMRGAAGCAWCGRLAAAALPLLRLMRLHPCFPEVHKQVIGTIQMTPLGSKRKRQTDELAMVVEPITYSDAVKKYGIEFKQITARDRSTQQKLSSMPREAFPERFPLSDVTAMQFCPTFRHHHKLALAMHAGLIVIVNV